MKNFPVYPGAPVFVVVQANGPGTASATFVNLQSNEYTTVGLTAPNGTNLAGNTVEWIVERPTLANNQAGTLANYGTIWMSSELAYTLQAARPGGYVVPGAPGNQHTGKTFTLYDGSGNSVAISSALGSSAQDIDIQGSAK